MFAAQFFVPPNKIDITDINMYKSIGHNYLTVVVVAAFWVVYLLVMIWARWRDLGDIRKVGACNVYNIPARLFQVLLLCSLFKSVYICNGHVVGLVDAFKESGIFITN